MNDKIKIIVPLLILAALLCGAYYEHSVSSAANFRVNTLTIEGPTTNSGATTMSGATTLSGVVTLSGTVVNPFDAVSLTSPTTSFSATGKSFVTLNSDANITGITMTDGTTGQVVTIVSGAGSNTMRWDDNTSTLSLGANITLTEGQQDALTLVCTGDRTWTALSAHDN
jgi:hypothetical protein